VSWRLLFYIAPSGIKVSRVISLRSTARRGFVVSFSRPRNRVDRKIHGLPSGDSPEAGSRNGARRVPIVFETPCNPPSLRRALRHGEREYWPSQRAHQWKFPLPYPKTHGDYDLHTHIHTLSGTLMSCTRMAAPYASAFADIKAVFEMSSFSPYSLGRGWQSPEISNSECVITIRSPIHRSEVPWSYSVRVLSQHNQRIFVERSGIRRHPIEEIPAGCQPTADAVRCCFD